ncbi:MAG: DNA polymerase II [Treponema sp.]|nr:DNA polymerase II [Treponema sp.]
MKARGFVVHCYADTRRDRLYLVGRLEDGRSFAAVDAAWRPSLHIPAGEEGRAKRVLASLKYETSEPLTAAALEAFDGREALLLLTFSHYRDYSAAGRLLEQAGIASPDGDIKPPEAYFIMNRIKGPVDLEGETRPGRFVDLVFPRPRICPASESRVSLKVASVDIETDVQNGTILAAGISVWQANGGKAGGKASDSAVSDSVASDSSVGGSVVRVLAPSPAPDARSPNEGIFFHPAEASLLAAFLQDIRRLDPDVITGWNFLDFDFPRLAERCAFHRIPFTLSRCEDEAKFFPALKDGDESGRRRSAAALVPGRQIVDALRIFRSGPKGWQGGSLDGFSLEAVAKSVLGEGKLVSSSGGNKIAELKELYHKDPARFGRYCGRDAELVLEILEKTGLFNLTVERASLTGVSLDKAWTSVVSFERVYAMELRYRGIAPVPLDPSRPVSGASGGTVLEPSPGLFSNVAVFDFRSLYPSIMLSFNIDPLAHARARGERAIVAPNGAAFSRERGILPELIERYFAARRRALDAGDEEASFVYKILMNSFYGVLGTPKCRYGRSQLAGAITSFARKWLHVSRDWFTREGFRVLYGDTDSLFVQTGLGDSAAYDDFFEWGKSSTRELNAVIARQARDEYDVESFLDMRFEKAYRRFMIPPLRNSDESRGRAKGYGGHLLNREGGLSVEVKGMEAVRSDYTPLARRIQLELLELVFSGCGEGEFAREVYAILNDMRRGKLDGELVYRKRLSRAPEAYTASTPPQVKAARALGWKNRRGTVEYVWTINGPQPSADEQRQPLSHAPLDYDHYADSQVLPAARSIASAAGWGAELFPSPGRGYFRDGQMELGL